MADHARAIAFGAAALLLFSSSATSAHADDVARLTFAWSAPAECSSEDDVRARIDRILGSHAAPHTDVDARVAVSKVAEGYRSEIELKSQGQVSPRRVEDVSCDALADAVALIVALAVDPEASAPKKEPTPPSPPAAPPPPPRKPVEASPPPPPEAPEPRRPIYFGGAVLLDTATLAALAAGAEMVVGYNPSHAAFELSGTWLATQDARLAAGSAQGASEHAFGLGARGCWEIFDRAGGTLDLGPCGGAEVGGIFADGFGATTSTEATAGLFRALLGGRVSLHFSRFALRLAAEAAIPFTRPSFVIDNAGTIQHISPATLRTTFGAELHF